MKHTLLALASLIASYCVSASPAATQSWVKDYVATNSTGGGGGSSISTLLSPTTVTVYDDNGSPATVTFNWCQNTNLALRVYDSNVSGMTNGLTFAKTADMRYYNATNYACQYITGQVEKVRMIFTSAVDRVVGNVTNMVYTGTNYIYGVVYYANVNGTRFRSFQTASNIYAFQPDTTNADSRIFYAIETYVSDITRNKIVTDPSFADVKKRKFSFWELFFPSAYAGWESPGELSRTKREYLSDGKSYIVWGYYKQHYFTDEPKVYTLGTVTWTLKNRETATYAIDYTLPCKIDGGIDVCKFGTDAYAVWDDSQYDNEAFKAELAKVLPSGRYQQLTRSESAWDAICAAANEKIAAYKEEYNAYKKMKDNKECPREEKQKIGEGVDECLNHVWTGKCGNWYCKKCGEKDSKPSVHNYSLSDEAGVCRVCQNQHDGTSDYCLDIPSDISSHRGWKPYQKIADDSLHYFCACKCYCDTHGAYGFCIAHDDPNTADGYFCTGVYGIPNGCYRNWTCARCGKKDHQGGNPADGCTVSATSHAFNGTGTWTQFETNGVNMCKGHYVCDHSGDPGGLAKAGCGSIVDETIDHIKSNACDVAEIPGNNTVHSNFYPCIRGCGYKFGEENEHNYGVILNPEKVEDTWADIMPPNADYHFSYEACEALSIPEGDEYKYCGHVHILSSNAHTWASQTYENPTQTTHDRYGKCGVCHYMKKIGTEPHTQGESISYWKNTLVHSVTSLCSQCAYLYHYGDFAHNIPTNSGAIAAESVGSTKHYLYYECTECCGIGVKNTGYQNNLEDCRALDNDTNYTLVDNPSGSDKLPCYMSYYTGFFSYGKKCTNLVNVAHHWVPSRTNPKFTHYCDHGEGHLEMAHSISGEQIELWNGENSIVRNYGICKCGYSNADDVEWEDVYTACDRDCGCIAPGASSRYRYVCVTNSLTYVSSWRTAEFRYKDKYNVCSYWTGTRCGCPYCTSGSGHYMKCACEMNGDEYLSYCAASLIEPQRLTDKGWRIADGSDPVYYVGNDVFSGTFSCFTNFSAISFPFLTNTMERSWYQCCSNCPKFYSANFSALTYADESAFEAAFAKCPSLSFVKFDSLVEANGTMFHNAFEGTPLTHLSFPSLRIVKGGDLWFGASNSIERLETPYLEEFVDNRAEFDYVFDFDNLKKVKYLNLGGVSSNVLVQIGNMAPLDSVEQIVFNLATNVLPFYDIDGNSHLVPTNNAKFVWVVPDDLLEAWRAAPGWSDYATCVVPASNPVRPASVNVTVTFDSNGGDAVASQTIVKGTGITPPSNIIKFAAASGGYDDDAFRLDGWYLDDDLSVQYDSGSAINSNTTLYAKWEDCRTITLSEAIVYDATSNLLINASTYRIGMAHDSAHPATAILGYGRVTPLTTISVPVVASNEFLVASGVPTKIDEGPWVVKVEFTGPDGVKTESAGEDQSEWTFVSHE